MINTFTQLWSFFNGIEAGTSMRRIKLKQFIAVGVFGKFKRLKIDFNGILEYRRGSNTGECAESRVRFQNRGRETESELSVEIMLDGWKEEGEMKRMNKVRREGVTQATQAS